MDIDAINSESTAARIISQMIVVSHYYSFYQ